MANFTPLSAALGGLLIGLAASLLMIGIGRIAGVSGFVSRLLPPYEDGDWSLRIAFLAGLLAAPWLYQAISGATIEITETAGTGLLIAAGLLVGLGSVLGGGCTSGHGVCGTARLSPRSLIATASFMLFGLATVFLMRHVLGIA